MDKIVIEKFTKRIIDGMYKYYGYIIEDFSSIQDISLPWGLSRILEDGTKMNIIFVDYDDGVLNRNFENDVCEKLGCRKDRIIKIVLTGGDVDSSEIMHQLNYFSELNLIQNNSIILDLKHSTMQISNSNMEGIAKQVGSIIDNNSRERSSKKNATVTYTIIGINIFLFIVSALLSGSFMNINDYVLISMGAKYNPAIEQGQWFRLVTCTFLHGGLIHIAANMYSLYSIGPLVESLYGKYKYIFMYFAAGIVSSLFSFWFSNSVSIGASGAIFGLLGIVFVFAMKERKRIGKDFLMNVGSVVVVNLFIGFSLPGIDNFGHIGGLFAGVILGLIVRLNTGR